MDVPEGHKRHDKSNPLDMFRIEMKDILNTGVPSKGSLLMALPSPDVAPSTKKYQASLSVHLILNSLSSSDINKSQPWTKYVSNTVQNETNESIERTRLEHTQDSRALSSLVKSVLPLWLCAFKDDSPLTFLKEPPNHLFGKPYVDPSRIKNECINGSYSYQFSVSHARGAMTYIGGLIPSVNNDDVPYYVVGTDIQEVQIRKNVTIENYLKLMGSQCTETEWIWIHKDHNIKTGLGPNDNNDYRLINFMIIWTIKESVLKAIGWGLSISPKRLNVVEPVKDNNWRVSLDGTILEHSIVRSLLFKRDGRSFALAYAVILNKYDIIAGPWKGKPNIRLYDCALPENTKIDEVVNLESYDYDSKSLISKLSL